MSLRTLLACASCAALFSFGHLARAGDSDPVAAEQLFLAGRAAMEHGDLATACQRFAESQRLDPAAGTLINLAECLERRGLIASSWQRWKEALDSLRSDDDRRKQVAARMTRIEAKLPRLELRLAPSAPASTVVTRDGLVLGAASLGLPLPVDPGVHQIHVTAEGHEPRDYSLTFGEGESRVQEVLPGAAIAARAESRPEPAAAPRKPVAAEPSSAGSLRTVGWIAGGTGAVALGVGGVFGALALGKKGTVRDECTESGGKLYCTQAGLDAASSGRTFATLANVGVGVGIVGLAVGATLLLTTSGDGAKTAVSARALPGGGALGVEGTF